MPIANHDAAARRRIFEQIEFVFEAIEKRFRNAFSSDFPTLVVACNMTKTVVDANLQRLTLNAVKPSILGGSFAFSESVKLKSGISKHELVEEAKSSKMTKIFYT